MEPKTCARIVEVLWLLAMRTGPYVDEAGMNIGCNKVKILLPIDNYPLFLLQNFKPKAINHPLWQ
jgi:hypothetical protein